MISRWAVVIGCAVPSFGWTQTLDFSGTTAAIVAEWLVPQDEFGRFWKAGPGAGIRTETPLAESFSFTASGRLSWLQRGESSRKEKIPNIVLVTLSFGLQSQITLSPSVLLSGDCSLANNTFVFTGRAAPDDFDNKVESEFGFQGSLRIRLGRIGGFASYQHIFTGLEPVGVASAGISYLLSVP